jgi:hypothetical protein
VLAVAASLLLLLVVVVAGLLGCLQLVVMVVV